MPRVVVPWCDDDQMTAHLDHFHAIFQGRWKIENVFRCAAIKDTIEHARELSGDWQVQIVQYIRTLVRRYIQDINGCRTQPAKKIIRVLRLFLLKVVILMCLSMAALVLY